MPRGHFFSCPLTTLENPLAGRARSQGLQALLPTLQI